MNMRAIGYEVAQPITVADALMEVDLPVPIPGPNDLRVRVKAISVNPADVQLRARVQPPKAEVRILGFDAAGIVDAVGGEVSRFAPGDEVFYAGAMDRPGTNSEFHLVDERLVGRKPTTLSFTQAAHHVINHHEPFEQQLEALGIRTVEYVAGLTATERHLADIERSIAPQGSLALIDDPHVLDIVSLKRKCVSVHWELMFTRSLYQTPDMIEQQRLLNEVADLVDAGVLRSTVTQTLGALNVANLRQAHVLVESGKTFGKTVLPGFA